VTELGSWFMSCALQAQ